MNGQPLRDDIEAKLGIDFEMANDANCFALAEAGMGAGRGFPTVFGVILGSGVGGGIVINGQIVNGCHGIAGEWGQMVIDPNGPPSGYGTPGTVEAMIAGPALEHFYRRIIGAEAEAGGDRRARGRTEGCGCTGDDRPPDGYFRQSDQQYHRCAGSARDHSRRRGGQYSGAL